MEQELPLPAASDLQLPQQQLQDLTSSLPDGTAQEAHQQARPLLLHLPKLLREQTRQPRRLQVVRPLGFSWTSTLGNRVWIRSPERSLLPLSPPSLQQQVQQVEEHLPPSTEAPPPAETAISLPQQQQDAVMEEGETSPPFPSPEQQAQLELLRQQEAVVAEQNRAYQAYKQREAECAWLEERARAALLESLQPSDEHHSAPQATQATAITSPPPQPPQQSPPLAGAPNAWLQPLSLTAPVAPPPPEKTLIFTPIGGVPLYISQESTKWGTSDARLWTPEMLVAHEKERTRWAEASQEERWGELVLQQAAYASWDLDEFLRTAATIQARTRVISWSLTLSTCLPLREARAGALSWRCQTRAKA